MKQSWLFCGMVCLFAKWISSTWLLCLFLMACLLYYIHHYRIHPLFFVFLIALAMPCVFHQEKQVPQSRILQVKEIKKNYIIAHNSEQKVLVYGVENVNFNDVIEIKGEYSKLDSIHNFHQFRFQTWLNNRGIQYQIQSKGMLSVKKGSGLRHHVYEKVRKLSNKKARTWVNSMLFQIHDDDVSYLISASGMHLSFLAFAIEKRLRRFLSKNNASMAVLLLLVIIGMSTLFSSSLLRVLLFRFITFLFPKDSRMDQLGKSLCLILLLFPYMAFELALILPLAFRLVQLFQRVALARFKTSFMVMIPIQFLFFSSCDPIQIVLFRFLRPCYGIFYVLAFLYLGIPNELLYRFVELCLSFLDTLQHFNFFFYFSPTVFWLLLWVLSLMHYITYKKKGITLLLLFVSTLIAPYVDPFGEVMMIDVGQGDCTLIKLPNKKGVILIDVMGSLYKNVPKDTIVPVLHSLGISKIDQVILTHEDYDHSGGLKELQALIPVKKVIRNPQRETTQGSLRIPFLNIEYIGKDANDNSLVTYLEVYGLKMLFMGDAGIERERAIMEEYANLRVDVVKLGHHGSRTSSSVAFLHQLEPSLALISSGRKNRYNHPHQETLSHLQAENIKYLNTAVDGGVSIKFCKYFAFFKTAEQEFGIIKTR